MAKENSKTKVDKNQPAVTSEESAGELLSSEERLVCEQVTAGVAPWSQRARALLEVDQGASEDTAAEASGLKPTQVKYWVDAFRKRRLDIFPEGLLEASPAPAISKATAGSPDDSAAEADPPATDSPAPSQKSKKKKKNKAKDKKSAKGKKGRKKKGKGKKKK